MQVQALESFLMVYETQNLSRASERLYVSQQCLSRQIQGLEAELGVQLFIRQKTGMLPTGVCHQIYPVLQEMMNRFEQARQICSAQERRAAPKFTIALADGMSNYIDVSLLSGLVRDCVGSELVIEERPGAECSRMLCRGKADMAFLLEPFDDTMLEHELIREDFGYCHAENPPAVCRNRPSPLCCAQGCQNGHRL